MARQIRSPRIRGDIEFNRNDSGLGFEPLDAAMTKFEARLCVEHWLAMCWAVETRWDCGTSGSWENAMWAYGNYRIDCLREAGLVSQEEINAIGDQWDWPPYEEPEEPFNDDGSGLLDPEERAEYLIAFSHPNLRDDDGTFIPATEWAETMRNFDLEGSNEAINRYLSW